MPSASAGVAPPPASETPLAINSKRTSALLGSASVRGSGATLAKEQLQLQQRQQFAAGIRGLAAQVRGLAAGVRSYAVGSELVLWSAWWSELAWLVLQSEYHGQKQDCGHCWHHRDQGILQSRSRNQRGRQDQSSFQDRGRNRHRGRKRCRGRGRLGLRCCSRGRYSCRHRFWDRCRYWFWDRLRCWF